MNSKKCRKAINFDLDTKALKEHYPNKNYRQAYKDLKKFLIQSGFKHRQWSGYVSKEPITSNKVISITKRMNKAFPWLKKCVNRFDVTDVGKQHDLTHLIVDGQNNNSKMKVKTKSHQVKKQKADINAKLQQHKAVQKAVEANKSKPEKIAGRNVHDR